MSALRSVQVLLVDDNANMRSLTSAILGAAGIARIHTADSGRAALDAMAEHPLDLVIVDFNMAPVDGLEFTKRVRASGDLNIKYLPIIMLTGYSERARVQEARDAGVTEFVAKPLTAKALLSRVNAVIMRPRPFVESRIFVGPCRRRMSPPADHAARRRGDRVP